METTEEENIKNAYERGKKEVIEEVLKIINKLSEYRAKDTQVYMKLIKSNVRMPNKIKLINKEELKQKLEELK